MPVLAYADSQDETRACQVLIDALIESVAKNLQVSQAEVGRRLGADRTRLYQWKTYRRKMPMRSLYKLVTMSGGNIPNALGQYQMEWHSVKVRAGKAKPCVAMNAADQIGFGG
jgi:hypothetical protein